MIPPFPRTPSVREHGLDRKHRLPLPTLLAYRVVSPLFRPPRMLSNVGTVIRLAWSLGARELLVFACTPVAPHDSFLISSCLTSPTYPTGNSLNS